MDGVVHSPPTLGDWFNLSQFTAVWLCHLALFELYLYYSTTTRSSKIVSIVAYITFFLFSIVPVVLISRLTDDGKEINDRRMFFVFYLMLFMFIVKPILIVAALLSFVVQAYRSRPRPDPGALSTHTLAAQAVLFAVVGICWMFRFSLPPRSRSINWYPLTGWATVDSVEFSVGQAALWLVVAQKRVVAAEEEETAPLIETEG
jgi:heme/copper-type cytochrome/quinol oxidase subunit 2